MGGAVAGILPQHPAAPTVTDLASTLPVDDLIRRTDTVCSLPDYADSTVAIRGLLSLARRHRWHAMLYVQVGEMAMQRLYLLATEPNGGS